MKIEIVTPRFNRSATDQKPGGWPGFSNLVKCDAIALREMGCAPWNKPNDPEDNGVFPRDSSLWLWPVEWYESIDDGTPIVDIMGESEVFMRGETCDDRRMGFLAYGHLVRSLEAKP